MSRGRLVAAGCDGATYEPSLTQGFNAVSYRRWSRAPKGCDALIELGNALLLVGCIPERLTVTEEAWRPNGKKGHRAVCARSVGAGECQERGMKKHG